MQVSKKLASSKVVPTLSTMKKVSGGVGRNWTEPASKSSSVVSGGGGRVVSPQKSNQRPPINDTDLSFLAIKKRKLVARPYPRKEQTWGNL